MRRTQILPQRFTLAKQAEALTTMLRGRSLMASEPPGIGERIYGQYSKRPPDCLQSLAVNSQVGQVRYWCRRVPSLAKARTVAPAGLEGSERQDILRGIK
jgi:hypothetical protein